MTKRIFATVSTEEINDILNNKTAKTTNYNTKNAAKLFNDYCKVRNVEIQGLEKTELDEMLSSFYVSARKIDGEKFKYQSLQQLRFALNRYFKDTHKIDIIHDNAFSTSSTVFHCLSKTLKKKV